ncbi:MAG: Lon protease family protein [Chloroflexota bacterium]
MTAQPLPPEKLRRVCDTERLGFETTADIDSNGSIIGQPRGTRAIEFGISMRGQGYNIFVVGDAGTGRSTSIRRFLQDGAARGSAPDDCLYVHNFATPHRPRAILLPAGRGAAFKQDVATLVETVRKELLKTFDGESYRESVSEMEEETARQQDELIHRFEKVAAQDNFALASSKSGPQLVPVAQGNALSPEALNALPADQRQSLEEKRLALRNRLDQVLYEVQQLEIGLQERLQALSRNVAAKAIAPFFARVQEKYDDHARVVEYLQAMEQDVERNLAAFLPNEEGQPDLRRYEVNLFVDNSESAGAPVVMEMNPTHGNLMGRMEHEVRQGMMVPHFTTLRAGSLHRANGGYLLLYARDFRRHRDAWDALQRALKSEEIQLQLPESMRGAQALAGSLDPEPVPLRVKVILLGSEELYYTFYDREEAFGELFKVKADFASDMLRDATHEQEYARFVAHRCRDEGLRHFESAAVARIIEFGSRLCEDQKRLTTKFGQITDVLRESDYWAGCAGRDVVGEDDVLQALQERIYRVNRVEERLREQIEEGDLLIATEGAVVGQVNSLSIIDLGDHLFGQPGRITARVYMGEDGVVNIEREVDMAGPIHNKGLLTLVGYLGGTYAQHQPLSLSASLTFEQNYMGVDGDSASAAELYALLSSLSQLPVSQAIAVTGSINQLGQMQAVGGVTEKIEGFFDVCHARGLTGEQGVVIPAANANNLMLRDDVVQAVRAGQFHVWAVEAVDEPMELLLGLPAGRRDEDGDYPEGTVHHAVQKTLRRLALELKSFGDHDHHGSGGDDA